MPTWFKNNVYLLVLQPLENLRVCLVATWPADHEAGKE